MSEEEKILKTIRYCANDYMKQEDGIQCFEWGDLWVLNEYIEKIKQENADLKEKVILLRASEPMLELEKYYGDRDKYKDIIEEAREEIEKSILIEGVRETGIGYYENIKANKTKLLQILDKVKEVK